MEKTFSEWGLYVLLFIWQIVQNLIGIGFWIYFKIRGDLETIVTNKYSKVYRSKYMSGGISLGAFAFVSNNLAKKETAIMHEEGHMWDSKLMGPMYVFIVGIPSLLNAMFDFVECYYLWFPEVWANRNAGVGLDKNCRPYIKDRNALKKHIL